MLLQLELLALADLTMYTLEQIYQRLTTGNYFAKQSGFTEPASGPGTGTMHTLDEIMAKAQPRALAKRVGEDGTDPVLGHRRHLDPVCGHGPGRGIPGGDRSCGIGDFWNCVQHAGVDGGAVYGQRGWNGDGQPDGVDLAEER